VLGDRYAYVCSSALFLEARKTIDGPGASGLSVGVELGGGFLMTALSALTAFVHD